MANKTVTSDAEFKTYVEGCAPSTIGTVYMNDNSKYWMFTKEATDKINSMCINGDDIEVWVYDGTDWITNRIPEVIDNLTTDSAVTALSAKQGKILDEKIDAVKNTSSSNYCKMPDGTLICWGAISLPAGTPVSWANSSVYNVDYLNLNHTFAHSFIEKPYVSVNCDQWAAGIVNCLTYTKTIIDRISIIRPSSTDAARTVRYIAVGRWK